MTYTVESFSWGTALIDPEIHTFETKTIEESQRELDRQWQNPKCFHVRMLSPLDPPDPRMLRKRLHLMKSRPTKDRKLRHYFEKITIPKGVKSLRNGKKKNLLRVCDFVSVTPASCLHLPAKSFFYEIIDVDISEIDRKTCIEESNAANLQNFETCLAAAAFVPTQMEALVGESDVDWYFLSEVNVNEMRATLSFSIMEAAKDFSQ